MKYLLIFLFSFIYCTSYSQQVTLECYWNDTLQNKDCDVCTKSGDVELFTGVIVQIINGTDTSRTKIYYTYGAKIRPLDVLLFDNKGHNVFFNIANTPYTYEEILEWFKNCHFNDLDNQKIDTFDIVGNVLRISLEDDDEAFHYVDLTEYLLDNQNLSLSGSGPTYNLNISSGTGTTFTQGSGITLTRVGNDLTISSIIGSPQVLSGNGARVTTLSDGGGTFTINPGTATSITQTSGANPVYTINSTYSWYAAAADGIYPNKQINNGTALLFDGLNGILVTNESPGNNTINIDGSNLQWYLSASSGGWTLIGNSSSPEFVTIAQGAGITTVLSGNTVTVTAIDQSASNELQNLSLSGSGPTYNLNISSGTGTTFTQGAGIVLTRNTNDLTIAAIDQSATNEIQTVDQFNIIADTLYISLSGDGELPKYVNLKPYIDSATAGYDTDSQSVSSFYIELDTLYISLTRGNTRKVYLGSLSFVEGSDKQQFDTAAIINDTLYLSLQRDSVNVFKFDLKPYLDDTDDQFIDTFEIVGNILRLSIVDDDEPFHYVDLSGHIQSYSHAGTTNYQNTLSNSGGTFTLNSGSGIGISHDGIGNVTFTNTGMLVWNLNSLNDAYDSTLILNDYTVNFNGINGINTFLSSAGSRTLNISGSLLQWYAAAMSGTPALIGDDVSSETVTFIGTGSAVTSISGDTVSIDVPVFVDTDDQRINLFYRNQDTIFIRIDEDTTRFITIPGFVDTDTDDQFIDTFTLVGNTLRLSIDDDGQAFKSVDLSSLIDAPQVLSGDGNRVTTLSGGGGTFTINAGASGAIVVTQTSGANPVYTISGSHYNPVRLNNVHQFNVFHKGTYNYIYSNGITISMSSGYEAGPNIFRYDLSFDGSLLQWYAAASSGTPALIGDAGSRETVTIAQGAGITTAISGNTITVTAIDQSASNELQNLSLSGSGPTYNLNISSGTGTTFTQGEGIVLTRVGNDLLIESTGGESQVLSGDGSGITSLSLSGGSFDINGGTNITVTQTSGANPIYTINNTYSYVWSLDGLNDMYAAKNVANANTVFINGVNGITFNRNSSSSDTFNINGSLLQWYIAASSGTPALIGDAASQETVTIAQGAGITTAISGNIVTVTAIDQSASNELQDLSFIGAAGGPVTLDISLSTSDVIFTAGTNISFSRIGNNLTINSTGGGSDYSFDIGVNGGSYTTISNTEQVSINGAGINVATISGNVITITGTEVDADPANELQTLAHSGTTSYTGTLSDGGGSFTFQSGNGITISHNGSGTTTINAIDISGTNEAQTWTNSGSTTYTGTLSQVSGIGGGSVTMQTTTGISLSHSSGTVTFSVVDQTVTNEQDNLTFTASGSSPITLNIDNEQAGTGGTDVQFVAGSNITLSATGTQLTINATNTNTDNQNLSLSGIGPVYNLNISGGTGTSFTQGEGIVLTRTVNDLLITALDSLPTNELQSFSHSGTGELLSTLSLGGGSINIKAGSNITITRSGSGINGIATISSTYVDTDTDNYVDALSYNTSNFILTIGRTGALSDLTATIQDYDWYKVGTTVPPTNTEDGFRNGKTGIGMHPVYILDVSTDARIYGHQIGRGGGNYPSNLRVGFNALETNTIGYDNTAIGAYVMSSSKRIYESVAIGVYSMQYDTIGYGNVAVGNFTFGNSINAGNDNVAVGYAVLERNNGGYSNIGIGSGALAKNTTGNYNIAIGDLAMVLNKTGIENIIIGGYAQSEDTIARFNVGIGVYALERIAGPLFLNDGNTAIGTRSGRNMYGPSNVGLGMNSLRADTTGSKPYMNSNVSVGYASMYSVNDSMEYNIAIGEAAMYDNGKSKHNISIGRLSLTNNAGEKNVVIGSVGAGSGLTTGDFNTIIGSGITFNANDDSLAVFANALGEAAIWMKGSGNTGMGTISPTQRLHVFGNARVTGAYYDSNNDPGLNGQFLTSLNDSTDWKYLFNGCPDCVPFINPSDTHNLTVDAPFFYRYDEGVGVLNVQAINLTGTNAGNVATQLYIAANGDERVFASSIESNNGSWTFNANLFYHNVQSTTTNLNIPSGITIPVSHYIINEGSTFTLTALSGETINGASFISYGTTDKLILLSGDGSGKWFATKLTGAAGTGTVTSVGIIQPAEGLTVTGSPVTGAGDMTLALANDIGAIENINTVGLLTRLSSNTWATRKLIAGTGISITNDDGTLGDITINSTITQGMTSWNLNGFDDIYPSTNISDGETVAFSGSNGIYVGLPSSGSNTMVINGVGLQWTLSASTGTPTLIGNAGTSETVLFQQGTGMGVSIVGNTVTFTNTAPDVVQDLSFSGAGPYNLNISNGGQFVRFIQGANITLSRSGNDLTISGAASTLTGSGMANYVTKWNGTSSLTTSLIQDNGSTVSIAGAPDASYQFKVASGNMKIGDASAGSLNKLYFGDGTFVYVGEDAADDRLYLKGTTLAVNIGGSTGLANYVLTANGAGTTSWQPVTVNLTLTGTAPGPFAIDNPNSVNDIRIFQGSGITLTRSGNDLTIAANVTGPDGLDYTGTADLIFLNTTGGSNWVAFSEGSGIQISQTGDNMTIAANDISNTNEAQTWTNSGSTSYTGTLSAANGSGGGTFTIVGTGGTTVNHSGGTITISSTSSSTNLSYSQGSNTINSSTGFGATINGFGASINILSGLGDKDSQYGTANQILISTGANTVDWQSLVAGSGISISGLTINASDVSNINEAQTLSAAGGATPTINLSSANGAGGGSVTLSAGTNVTLNQVGNTITINANATSDGSITNEGLLSVGAGAANTSLIQSNTSGSPDITLQEGSGIDISESGNVITIAASDVSNTNEAQTLSAAGTTTPTVSLSVANGSGGGTITFFAGTDISLIQSGGTITINSIFSEDDGSVSNEGSLTVAAGSATSSIINSNTFGQTGVTLQAAGIIGISEVGNVITITASEGDGSSTNESQTLSSGGTTSPTINLSVANGAGGGTITLVSANSNLTLAQSGGQITFTAANQTNQLSLVGSGISSIFINNDLGSDATINLGTGLSFNTGTNTLNVADVSNTNEAQTFTNTGTTTWTGTLSAANGSGGGTFTVSASGSATISRIGDAITITGTGVKAQSLTNTYIPKYNSSLDALDNSIMDQNVNGFITITPSYANFGLVVDGGSYTGIRLDDESGTGLIGYNNSTFTIGCGSCHTSITGTKALAVYGGVVIGANEINASAPTNGLRVEGDITALNPIYVTDILYDRNNQAGTSGQFLSTVGTGVDWVDAVTSVGIIGNTGISISGSPITSSGNITLNLQNDLAGIEAFTTQTGVVVRSATNTYITRTIAAGSGISVTNGDGISANPTISATVVNVVAGNNITVTPSSGTYTVAQPSFTSLTTGMTTTQVLYIGSDGTPETSSAMTFSSALSKLSLSSAAPIQMSYYSGGNSCAGCVLYLDGNGNITPSGNALINANNFFGDFQIAGGDIGVDVNVPVYLNRASGFIDYAQITQSMSGSGTLNSSTTYAWATTSGITITLGTASAGRVVYVANSSGSQITVAPSSGTINGQANIQISAYKGGMFFCVNGTTWMYYGG